VTAGGGGGGDSPSFFGEQVSQYKELAARLDAFSSSAASFFSFKRPMRRRHASPKRPFGAAAALEDGERRLWLLAFGQKRPSSFFTATP
jgi:hypothetical protein